VPIYLQKEEAEPLREELRELTANWISKTDTAPDRNLDAKRNGNSNGKGNK
jgi:hypothetical protein